jgi:hypothetical protein
MNAMKTLQRTAVVLVALQTGAAMAHPGHGAESAVHWHAFDAWGWALALAVAAGAWWWIRRK